MGGQNMTDRISLRKTKPSLCRVLLMCLGWRYKTQYKLKDLIDVALARGLIDARSVPMIEGVKKVGEMHVRDVMIPYSKIVVIDREAGLTDTLAVVAKHGHSRYPVMGDTYEQVTGILLAKDLLAHMQEKQTDAERHFSIKDCVRPAVLVPETKRLSTLLEEFKKSRNHMAIVVDEHGGVTGLITIEDVVEQIVGDIVDEHDTETTSNIRRRDNIWLVDGATSLEEFNRYFSTDIQADDGSVAGIVIRELGGLPKGGETVDAHGFVFKVTAVDGRRIKQLEVCFQDT